MDTDKFIGAWSLVSSLQSCNGTLSKTFGDPPSGQIQYTADGRMSAFLMDPNWKDIGENACKQAHIFFAYGGRWTIEGNAIHHFIDFCSAPSKIGTTFTRQVTFINDNEIALRTKPETSPSGKVYETTLVWKKVG